MPDYHVPPDRPDYQVPTVTEAKGDACPQCGSQAILPSLDLVRSGVPRQLRVYDCARCGTRYRIRPAMPTWREISRDVTVYIGLAIFLIIVLMLLL